MVEDGASKFKTQAKNGGKNKIKARKSRGIILCAGGGGGRRVNVYLNQQWQQFYNSVKTPIRITSELGWGGLFRNDFLARHTGASPLIDLF